MNRVFGILHRATAAAAFCALLMGIAHADERKLKANDEIELSVFGEDSLGVTVKIDSSGAVNFPLVGTIEVVGKTPTEIAREVEARLEKDYIRDANVTVSVVEEYKEKPKPVVVKPMAPPAPVKKEIVTILGEVRAPGTVEFEGEEIEILTALARVGGLSQLANPKRVTVKRVSADGSAKTFSINVADLQTGTDRFTLLPNDTVSVPKRIF